MLDNLDSRMHICNFPNFVGSKQIGFKKIAPTASNKAFLWEIHQSIEQEDYSGFESQLVIQIVPSVSEI